MRHFAKQFAKSEKKNCQKKRSNQKILLPLRVDKHLLIRDLDIC